MQERLKELPKKFLEYWNKWTSKQKTIIISAILAVVVMIAILVAVLGRTKYVELDTFADTKTAGSVVSSAAMMPAGSMDRTIHSTSSAERNLVFVRFIIASSFETLRGKAPNIYIVSIPYFGWKCKEIHYIIYKITTNIRTFREK